MVGGLLSGTRQDHEFIRGAALREGKARAFAASGQDSLPHHDEGEVGMTSQRRVSGTAVERTLAVLGSAIFFVVAPCTLAGLVPWSITGWQLQPPFLGLELTRDL